MFLYTTWFFALTADLMLQSHHQSHFLLTACQCSILSPSPTLYCSTAHGVTKLRCGVRYSLFLCNTNMTAVHAASLDIKQSTINITDLSYLKDAVLDQFRFYERALPLLQAATTDQLNEFNTEYLQFAQSSRNDVCTVLQKKHGLSLGAELMMRTHMIHPIAYLQSRLYRPSCDSSQYIQWVGVDLIAAVRRQVLYSTSRSHPTI